MWNIQKERITQPTAKDRKPQPAATVSQPEAAKVQGIETLPVSPNPILADDINAFLDKLDAAFDTGAGREIAEGRRIQFFEGKRKVKDGTTKKTGHHYWEWVYKHPDTGKRVRPYGGAIATVPNLYQYRRGQYEAAVHSRGAQSLADTLLRPALDGLRRIDTGKKG